MKPLQIMQNWPIWLAIVMSDQCLLNIILLLCLFVYLLLLFFIIIIIIIYYYCYYLFILLLWLILIAINKTANFLQSYVNFFPISNKVLIIIIIIIIMHLASKLAHLGNKDFLPLFFESLCVWAFFRRTSCL